MAVHPNTKPPKGWHSRGYLPHFDGGTIPQTVTFRLADALPQVVLDGWKNELATMPEARASSERRQRIERCLDSGAGKCWLSGPQIAETVENALLYFEGQRYLLEAWVVMPNHVHALFTPMAGHTFREILHSWKSFTSNEANRLLARSGEFWYPDYFDRFVRNPAHFVRAVEYIEMNPVAAGLCLRPEDWPYGSARYRRSAGFQPATENQGGQDGRAPKRHFALDSPPGTMVAYYRGLVGDTLSYAPPCTEAEHNPECPRLNSV